MNRAFVYVIWSAIDGRCLYVGQSRFWPIHRIYSHRSRWLKEPHIVDVCEVSTSEVDALERDAIVALDPERNIAWRGGVAPMNALKSLRQVSA